jgi:hypothetical protein
MANVSLLLQALTTGLVYYTAFVLRLNYTHFLIFTFIVSLISSVLMYYDIEETEKEMNNIATWIMGLISFIMVFYRYGFLKFLGTLLLQLITVVFVGLLI